MQKAEHTHLVHHHRLGKRARHAHQTGHTLAQGGVPAFVPLPNWNICRIALLEYILHADSNRFFPFWMRKDVKCFVTDRLEDDVGEEASRPLQLDA